MATFPKRAPTIAGIDYWSASDVAKNVLQTPYEITAMTPFKRKGNIGYTLYLKKRPQKKEGEKVKKRKTKQKQYYIVRTYSAGVFAGYIEKRKGQEVVMTKARRLWMWKGAASLSQLAMEGVKYPQECKFPCEVDRVELLQAIEILECTNKCKASIAEVPEWRA